MRSRQRPSHGEGAARAPHGGLLWTLCLMNHVRYRGVPGGPDDRAIHVGHAVLDFGLWAMLILQRLRASVFIVQFAALDIALRGVSCLWHPAVNVAYLLQSALLWSVVWAARGSRTGRILGASFATLLAAIQLTFRRYYHGNIDVQVLQSAAHCWSDVWPVVVRALPQVLWIGAPLLVVEYALLSDRNLPSRRPARPAAILVASALVLGPVQHGPPDLQLLESVRLLWQPEAHSSVVKVSVPPLVSSRPGLPNVLFIMTESVRASDYCVDYAPDCLVSPQVNALVPDRVGLHQARALGSYTAIAVSSLVTGRIQVLPRSEVIASPMVFDYARATRKADSAYDVAYYTSHSSGNFERDDVPQSVHRYLALEMILGRTVNDDDEETDEGVDRLLAERAEPMMASLRKPAFVLLQFGGTHAPYYVDEADAPFQPWQHEVSWSGLPALHNAYRNSIHDQDKQVARCVRAFLQMAGADPWLIVFTSDHGEAFGEHAAIHHGQDLYDEQLHVPAFIAWGNGALTAQEAQHLALWRDESVTHLDYLPTILDAMGVLDSFAMKRLSASLQGRSLLRPPVPMAEPVPISNCTGIFTCPFNNWGMLDGFLSVQAQAWDGWWRCVDMRTSQELPMATADCLRLQAASRRWYPTLPNGAENK